MSIENDAPTAQKLATFAGGCFWCMEAPFEELDGVIKVTSGYSGGEEEDPTYEEVSSGTTGHYESIQVIYDPAIIRYEQLLEVFWRNIDPTDTGGQFVDRGDQYKTAVFYHDDEQKKIAEESKRQLASSGRFTQPIATEILPYTHFYPAEDYHQQYHFKSPFQYSMYRMASGRDKYIEETWGEESA